MHNIDGAEGAKNFVTIFFVRPIFWTSHAKRTKYLEKNQTKNLKPNSAKKNQKRTKRTKPNIRNQTLSKRTRFEVFGFNETKLATLILPYAVLRTTSGCIFARRLFMVSKNPYIIIYHD